MTNPDRVEFGSESTLVSENHKTNGHFPRWLRVPAFAARTFLAILTTAPGTAVAADILTHTQNPFIVYAADNQCNNTELVYLGTGFIDDPFNEVRNPAGANDPLKINTLNTLDFGDIWMGSPQFSDLVVEYTANPADPKAKWEEIGKYKMVNNGTFSLARFKLDGLNANSATTYLDNHREPSVDIRVYFDNERDLARENPDLFDYSNFFIKDNAAYGMYARGIQGPAINRIRVVCGEVDMIWEGRIASDLELEKAVKNPNFVFQRWGPIFDSFLRSHSRDFTSDPRMLKYLSEPNYFTRTNKSYLEEYPVSQEETRKAFQKYLDSKKLLTPPAAYTPIITPAPVYTPRPAATPTLTKEQTNTPVPKLTPSATKKPEAVISPIPTTPASSAVSTEKDSDLLGWLLGLGAVFLAGLTANEFYKRWKSRKGTTKGGSPGIGSLPPGPTFLGPSNPNTAPSTGPSQPKNPEWIIGQVDFKRRWQTAKSKLPPVQPGDNGNMQGYVLDRFKAGMNIVHEVLLEDATNVPEVDTRVRAGIEYLIPEIWPDNRIFKSFFDPGFNAGYLTPEDLAKIIYLPESYRNLSSFTKGQKREVNSIRRILLHALHPDLLKSDADPKLQDYIDELLKKINPVWPYIDRLMK